MSNLPQKACQSPRSRLFRTRCPIPLPSHRLDGIDLVESLVAKENEYRLDIGTRARQAVSVRDNLWVRRFWLFEHFKRLYFQVLRNGIIGKWGTGIPVNEKPTYRDLAVASTTTQTAW